MDWLTFLSCFIWPISLFIFIRIFKNELSSLISRIKSAKISGYKAEFYQDQNLIQEAITEVKKIDNVPDVPSFYESQEDFLSKLEKTLDNPNDVNKFCSKNYPIIFLNYSFFKIYLNIFGSQIELLFYLNSIHQVPEKELKQFYIRGKESSPEIYKSITFESYILFLKNNNLIMYTNDLYSITPLGRDFIKFLSFEMLPRRESLISIL